MKKLIAILMALAILLSFAACGEAEEPTTEAPTNAEVTEPVTEPIDEKQLTVDNGKGSSITVNYPADFTFNEANTEGNFLAHPDAVKCGTLEREDINIGFGFSIISTTGDTIHDYAARNFKNSTIFEEGAVGEYKTYIRQLSTSRMTLIVCLNDYEFAIIEFNLPAGATKEDYAVLRDSELFTNFYDSIVVTAATAEENLVMGAPVTTENGYVSITPCGGFIYDESDTTGAIALKNGSLGANAAIYVYDEQSMELEVQKKYFGYAYPNKEYTDITIGENTFAAIESNTGTTYLVAETSSGMAMYVAVWSCSVEDAKPVLETIVIG